MKIYGYKKDSDEMIEFFQDVKNEKIKYKENFDHRHLNDYLNRDSDNDVIIA